LLRRRLERLAPLPPLGRGFLRIPVDQDARACLAGKHRKLTGKRAFSGTALLADERKDLHLLASTLYEGVIL